MKISAIEKIADAVLFEGYMLYPYRASAIKNRQRWNFGTLYPRLWAEAQRPQEPFCFHAEVLIEATAGATFNARIRFLQIADAQSEGRSNWSEGLVRSRDADGLTLADLTQGWEQVFDFSELAGDENQTVQPTYAPVSTAGLLRLRAEPLEERLYKLNATFSNETDVQRLLEADRVSVQGFAFTSAHLLLHVEGGQFVSLLEPAPAFESQAKGCVNQGVFPVLAGAADDRSSMLCSPIILYDHPQVAPESEGDYFDGCEMDEMLALRVLTLTDDEKAEIRKGDVRAREILARTETLPADHLLKLHGAVRDLRPVSVQKEFDAGEGMEPWSPFEERPALEVVRIFGVDVRSGDKVRLWPQRKADIMDMAMEGKVAIVEAIEQDLEDNVQLAVVLEDDPGSDMGMLRQPGHRFFFHPDEVEPLTQEVV